MKIKNVEAIEILDSRGNPTVESNLLLENGISGRAMVPSLLMVKLKLSRIFVVID